MSRQDRACQPSAPEEVKVGANENGYPICSLHDRQGEEKGSEERGLSWQLREGYLTGVVALLACHAALLDWLQLWEAILSHVPTSVSPFSVESCLHSLRMFRFYTINLTQ